MVIIDKPLDTKKGGKGGSPVFSVEMGIFAKNVNKRVGLAVSVSVLSGLGLFALLLNSADSSPSPKPMQTASSITGSGAFWKKDSLAQPNESGSRSLVQELDLQQAEEEARSLAREFRFDEAAKALEPLALQRRLSSRAKQVYEDVSLLANVFAKKGEKPDPDLIPSLFDHLQDEEIALLGTLALPDDLRGKVIVNKDSLNPIFDGKATIRSVLPEQGEMKRIIEMRQGKVEKVFRIDFVIEGFPLVAYVMKKDGHVRVYEIQEKEEGTTPYRTISEWERLYKTYQLTPSSEYWYEE